MSGSIHLNLWRCPWIQDGSIKTLKNLQPYRTFRGGGFVDPKEQRAQWSALFSIVKSHQEVRCSQKSGKDKMFGTITSCKNKHYKVVCVCNQPPKCEVCSNYEVVVFQPWTELPLNRNQDSTQKSTYKK